MPSLHRVNPGDLITAEDWNLLIDKVTNLEAVVVELQQGGGPVNQNQVKITDLTPSAQIHRGEELHITGVNFYRFIGATRVKINGLSVEIKPTSIETQLDIVIPVTTPLGSASLEVSNSITSDTRTLTILEQELPLTDDIAIQWISVSPQRIKTGDPNVPYRFRYQVVSHTNRAATYTFTPVASVSAWQAGMKILNANGEIIQNQQMSLTPNQPATVFFVEGPLPTALGSGGQFTLRLDVTAEDRQWSQGDHTFRENELVLSSDADIELGSPLVDPSTAFDDASNTVSLAPGGVAAISYEVVFKAVGTFNRIIDHPNTDGWTIEPLNPGVQDDVTVTEGSLAAANGRQAVNIILKITAPGGHNAASSVSLGYQNSTKTDSRTVEFYQLRTT